LHRQRIERAQTLERPRHRRGEARSPERLEDVVQRVDIECANRVFVVRGDEHDAPRDVGTQRFEDAESVEIGHLDVEKEKVWSRATHQRDRLTSVRRFTDHRNVGVIREAVW
jgi:hypothetical protein